MNNNKVKDISILLPPEELVPRWKWFKPPKWKIFRWAYTSHIINRNKRMYSYDILQDALADFKGLDKAWLEETDHPDQ